MVECRRPSPPAIRSTTSGLYRKFGVLSTFPYAQPLKLRFPLGHQESQLPLAQPETVGAPVGVWRVWRPQGLAHLPVLEVRRGGRGNATPYAHLSFLTQRREGGQFI